MAKRAQGSNGRPFRRSYRTFVAIGRWEAVPFWDAPPPVLRYGEAALGASVLIGAGALASRGVWPAEIRVFRWANELPDEAFRAVWAPMQYGTFGAVPALAVLALARRRAPLAVAVAAAGTTAWVLAKAVKPIVAAGATGRDPDGRSSARERGRDLGFPSGHSAVSAALTIAISPHVDGGWRLACTALAGFVPVARMYVGVHLPRDVLGGSALGLAVGSLVNLAARA
jgi:membrane-associated phospholipid phosphatase